MSHFKCTKPSHITCPSSHPSLPHPLPNIWSQRHFTQRHSNHPELAHTLIKKYPNHQQTGRGEGREQVTYLRLVYFQACSASGFIHFGQVSVPSLLHLASYALPPHMRSSCTNRASSSSHPQSRASHESWELPLSCFTILFYVTTFPSSSSLSSSSTWKWQWKPP